MKTATWNTQNDRRLLLLAILITFTLTGVFPTPARADANGNQIWFAVRDGRFTYLKISGGNQDGQQVTWETGDGKQELRNIITRDWWWKGTINLRFYAVGSGWQGWRECVIDYLKEPRGMNYVAVIYTEGQGCSGEAGSARPVLKREVELLYKLLFYEDDALEFMGMVEDAKDAAECSRAVIRVLSSGSAARSAVQVIRGGRACSGVALDQLNELLKKYFVRVE
jgi:hypothetical protein